MKKKCSEGDEKGKRRRRRRRMRRRKMLRHRQVDDIPFEKGCTKALGFPL
jgi:hypothetical protein